MVMQPAAVRVLGPLSLSLVPCMAYATPSLPVFCPQALQCLQACCALSAHLCLEARAAKSLAAATEQKLDRCGLAVAAGKLRLLQHQRKLLLKLASGSGARGGALQAAGLGPTGAAGARWQGQAGEQEAGSPQRHADVR